MPVTRQSAMPPRHHRVRWTVLSVVAVVVVILVTGSWLAYRAISVINTKKLDGGRLSFFQQLAHLVTANDQQLQGEADDRVNILLLGLGGPGHDGPYLTDTMMVASFQPSTKQLALLSIPRDLVVDIPGYDYRKINNVLSFGRDQKYPGGGEALTVKVVSDLLNIPIQYYARVDFTGFKEVVDLVGGVTVAVDTAFSDYQYPDNAYGYAPVSFQAGVQTMDGDRALKFTRSRHGNNGEGSDFARAKRQQQIIVALKDKLLSFGTMANPKKISDILGSLGSHSQTNMEVWEMVRLARLAGSLQTDRIINKVLDDSVDGFLRAATGVGGAFILVPRDSTYQDIQFLARNIFLDGAADGEDAKILVVNATSFANLGQTTKQALEALGLTAAPAISLTTATVGQTVLISARPGQYPATEQLLRLFSRAAGSLSLADWQRQTGDATIAQALTAPISVNTNRTGNTNAPAAVVPDLVLVLGQDQPKPSTAASLPFPAAANNTNGAKNTNSSNRNAPGGAGSGSAGNVKATNGGSNSNSATNANSASSIKNVNISPN
ncbi:MAG: LCP family protein [Patescibacteria group bacterium]